MLLLTCDRFERTGCCTSRSECLPMHLHLCCKNGGDPCRRTWTTQRRGLGRNACDMTSWCTPLCLFGITVLRVGAAPPSGTGALERSRAWCLCERRSRSAVATQAGFGIARCRLGHVFEQRPSLADLWLTTSAFSVSGRRPTGRHGLQRSSCIPPQFEFCLRRVTLTCTSPSSVQLLCSHESP